MSARESPFVLPTLSDVVHDPGPPPVRDRVILGPIIRWDLTFPGWPCIRPPHYHQHGPSATFRVFPERPAGGWRPTCDATHSPVYAGYDSDAHNRDSAHDSDPRMRSGQARCGPRRGRQATI